MKKPAAVLVKIGSAVLSCPVMKTRKDAFAVYDVTANEIVATDSDRFWDMSKSKALRERGTGNKCVYIGAPEPL